MFKKSALVGSGEKSKVVGSTCGKVLASTKFWAAGATSPPWGVACTGDTSPCEGGWIGAEAFDGTPFCDESAERAQAPYVCPRLVSF